MDWNTFDQERQSLVEKAFDMVKDEPIEMQVSLAMGSDITWTQEN